MEWQSLLTLQLVKHMRVFLAVSTTFSLHQARPVQTPDKIILHSIISQLLFFKTSCRVVCADIYWI